MACSGGRGLPWLDRWLYHLSVIGSFDVSDINFIVSVFPIKNSFLLFPYGDSYRVIEKEVFHVRARSTKYIFIYLYLCFGFFFFSHIIAPEGNGVKCWHLFYVVTRT